MADFFEGKNPVTIAMIAVIIVVAAIATFSGNISGYATSSTEVELIEVTQDGQIYATPLYVGTFGHDGWGLCTGAIPWEAVDRLCKDGLVNPGGELVKYAGALPEEGTARPCRQEAVGTAYVWDLATPLHLGGYDTQTGYGLTAVKCVPM